MRRDATSPERAVVKINPSLMFSGACGHAFRRDASLFGGEIVYMLTYAESPLAHDVPPEWRDKVWFARLRVRTYFRRYTTVVSVSAGFGAGSP